MSLLGSSVSNFATSYSYLNNKLLTQRRDIATPSSGYAKKSLNLFSPCPRCRELLFLVCKFYKCIGRIYCFTCKGLKRTGYDTQHDYCCEAWKLLLVITLCRSNIILSLCDTTVVIYFQLLLYTIVSSGT